MAGWAYSHRRSHYSATGTLPHTDPYSFFPSRAAVVCMEWGADLIVGAIHRASGLQGVALFLRHIDRSGCVAVVPAALAGVVAIFWWPAG